VPCSDITEVIQVVIDNEDRLKDYHFAKRSCGRGVGTASLLIDQLRGLTVSDVLAYDAEKFLDEYPIAEELEEFLSLKHLFAVQSALEVLTGLDSCGPGSACAAAEIGYDGEDMVLDGRIAIDLVTEKIKSCGNCGTCGANKKKQKVIFN